MAGVLLLLVQLSGKKVPAYAVEKAEMRQSVVTSGRVRTPQRIELAAQITGRVTRIAVTEGARIEAEQLLVNIDDAELRAARDQARATLVQSEARWRQLGIQLRPLAEQGRRQAEANWQQAKKQYERTRELVDRGFYSPAQLDEASRALTIAESQLRNGEVQLDSHQPDGAEARVTRSMVEQSRAALALAEARLAYASLKAPVAGTVLSRQVEAGDIVQPGKTLLVLAPHGESELTAQIDEKNISLLHLGQSALVSADAYAHTPFKAEVSYIAPAVDALRGSIEVRLRVPAAPTYLKHEMTVSIDIETGRQPAALQIPADSLHDAGSSTPWVMAVRDGKTQRQPVRLGLRGSGRVEITEGLQPGEIVLPASLSLPEGQRVRAAVNSK